MKLHPAVVGLAAALIAGCAALPPAPYTVAVPKATRGNSAAG